MKIAITRIEIDKFNMIDEGKMQTIFKTLKGQHCLVFNIYHVYHMRNHICILCEGNLTFILGITKDLNAFRVTT